MKELTKEEAWAIVQEFPKNPWGFYLAHLPPRCTMSMGWVVGIMLSLLIIGWGTWMWLNVVLLVVCWTAEFSVRRKRNESILYKDHLETFRKSYGEPP